MTVSSSTNRASYSANGSTTVFAYGFKIFDQDDLTVILRAADGTETTQTITTHYTVSGVGSVSGGNVTFVTAPASGVTVVILREQPLTQGLDLVANDPFPSASFEDQLDKLTFMVQQHDEELGRAIKASRTNTLTGSEFTISAADRANKVFSFDSSGDLSVTQELGTFKGDWAASTAYVERDLVRDSSDGSIYIVTSAHTSSGSTPLDTNTNSSKYDAIFDVGAMIAGTVTMTGNLTVQGNTTLGNASSDSITMTGTAANLRMSTTNVTDILDEDTMSSDSATALATQQSIKAYVDSQVGASDTLTEILGNGNTTSGANIQMTTTDELQFRDTALKISSSADGQLDIDADTEIEITAPTVDINASTEVNISGAAKIGGTLNIDTIDELTTDAGTTINSTFIGNNKIGIGTSVVGDTQVAIRGSAAKLRLESTSAGNHNWDVGVFSTSFRIYHQATGQNPLWINSSDNVGIGTTSPSTKLDVNGTVTADGLTVDGDAKFTDISPAIILSENDTTDVNTRLGNYGGDFNITTVNDSDVYVANRLTVDHATGDISFYEDTGTTAKFFWDASTERLGIANASPATALDVTGTVTADGLTLETNNASINFTGTTGNNFINVKQGLRIDIDNDNNQGATSFGITHGGGTGNVFNASENGDISFYEDTGTTAKFFWDASAESLLVGKTASDTGTSAGFEVSSGTIYPTRSGASTANFNRLTSDGNIVNFRKDGTTVGSISVTSSATAYNTSSDRRLKENIGDADDAGSLIDAIQVRKFDWKVDGSHQRYGMIAQELNDVAPEAVSIPEDEEEMQSVDYSKLVPMLIKEIQSLRNRLAELEAN